ncbi:hypothetical protein [Burkholderia sp. BCC1638]|uniref:hypothetical protein n=1 Tax=Burkholderia sp. BCC1638 TaxID=2681391 RepID=UPI00158BC0FF|nr:hypothetical protein [Burkholderia sp. BCC1638]
MNLFVDLENLAGKQIATKGSGDSNMRSAHVGVPVILLTFDDERDARAAIPAHDTDEIPRQWIETADYGKPSPQSIVHDRRWQVAAAGTILFAVPFVS